MSLFLYDDHCESDGDDCRYHDEMGDKEEDDGGGDGHDDGGGSDSGMRMVSGVRSLL